MATKASKDISKTQSASKKSVTGSVAEVSARELQATFSKVQGGLSASGRPETLLLDNGMTLQIELAKGGTSDYIHRLTFSDGRTISTADGGKTYRDSNLDGIDVLALELDRSSGSISYRLACQERAGRVIETGSGEKHFYYQLDGQERQLRYYPDGRRESYGPEGRLSFSSDAGHVTINTADGGSVEIDRLHSLMTVTYPDGHTEQYAPSPYDLRTLDDAPVGFYFNWLSQEPQAYAFEWGTINF